MKEFNFVVLDGKLIPEEEASLSESRRAEMESLRQELHCAEEASEILQKSKEAPFEVVQWSQGLVSKIYEKIYSMRGAE